MTLLATISHYQRANTKLRDKTAELVSLHAA
jgi:hypothetical protein